MKVRVIVTLKSEVLDPQGKAAFGALRRLGYEEISDVRVGKFIELTVDGTDRTAAGRRVDDMCKKLLSNPIIENARYEFAD